MKTVERIGFQGDVTFRRVEATPRLAKQNVNGGPIVVAHSETGHHHTINAADVIHFEVGDPFVCYLRVDGEYADVVHHRPFDTHETIRLLGGGAVYEVRRQREWTPEGERMVQD